MPFRLLLPNINSITLDEVGKVARISNATFSINPGREGPTLFPRIQALIPSPPICRPLQANRRGPWRGSVRVRPDLRQHLHGARVRCEGDRQGAGACPREGVP